MLGRDQQRQERLPGRSIEGTHGSVEEQNGIDGPHGVEAAQGERQKENGAQSEAAVANLQNSLAGKPVGSVAGDQEKEDAGRKLGQANQAEIKRPVSERIDL